MIEAEFSFGYRLVAASLGMSKNAVQRIKDGGTTHHRLSDLAGVARNDESKYSSDSCETRTG